MKVDNHKIEQLRAATGRDYGFCQKALIHCRNDYDEALKYIAEYEQRIGVRTYKRLSSILFGEQSYRFKVLTQGDVLIDIPLLIPVLLMLLIPIPSFLIAMFMILTMVTDSSISINIVDKKEIPLTIRKQERKKRQKAAEKIARTTKPATSEIYKDNDGYSIIEIQ